MENKMIKILAIDDNRDNLISLKALLSEIFPQLVVYTETSGQAGIESARKNDPDVILLDIVMPGMDGYQVCKTLKADEQLAETPVIFITALNGDKQSRILALEAGGEAFLAKPIDSSELKAQIQAMLKIKEAAAYKRNEKLRLEKLVQERTEALKKANVATLNLLEDLKKENEIRKQSEEALRESEEKYRALFEKEEDAIFIFEPDTFIIVDANPAMTKTYGYSYDELIGMNCLKLSAEIEKSKSTATEADKKGKVNVKLCWHKKKDGTVFPLEMQVYQTELEGSTVGFAVVRDITERKQAEEKILKIKTFLDSVVDMSPFAMWISDKEGTIIRTNNSLREIINLEDENIVGKYNVFNDKNLEEQGVMPKIKNVFKMHEPARFSVSWNPAKVEDVYFKDARNMFIDVSMFPILNGKDELENVVCQWVDITERKHAKEALKKEKIFSGKIVETANAIIVGLDKNHIIQIFNRGAEQITGYKKEEVIGKDWFKIFFPENILDEMNEVWKGAWAVKSHSYINPILAKSGEERFISWQTTGMYESDDISNHLQISIGEDITERKQAEEKLKESEEKYRLLHENGGLGIGYYKPNGTIISYNKEAAKNMNGEPDDFAGKLIFEIFPKSEAEFYMERIQKSCLSDQPISYEDNVSLPLGDKYFLSTYSKVTDSNNQILGIQIISQDITERKQAEEALKESEEKFRAIYDNAPLSYQSLNDNGSFKDVNPTWLSTLGYERDEVIGKFYKDFLHPDWQAHFEKNFPAFKKRGYVHDVQYKIRHKKGHYLDISFEGCVGYNPDGSFKQTYCVFQDITDRKQAEEKLLESEEKHRTLVSTTSEGFWMIDNKSNTIDVNMALCNMLEYEENELVGRSIFDFVDEENAKIFQNQVENAKTTEQRSYEIVLRSRNGKEIHTLFNATSQFDETGKQIGSFAFITDINDRIEAERMIKHNLKEKTALIQEIYHRTKNNMQVIISMLRMQSHTLSNQKESEQTGITLIQEAFSEIINRINAMSLVHHKLCQGQDMSQINLKDYIEDLVNQLKLSFLMNYSRISLNLELQEIYVMIDTAVPLGLILNELISNVFKHAFPDETKGEISIRLFKDENDAINIQVNDNGVGIPADLDLRNLPSMGVKIIFNLVESQLKGLATYSVDNGLKWHLKVNEAKTKKRI